MGEKRKSEFSGEVYGDWIVTGRAPALEGKRRWFCQNQVNGEERVVLQTALNDLKQETTPPVASNQLDDSWANDLPVEDGFVDSEPEGQEVSEPVTIATLDAALGITPTYTPKGAMAESAVIARRAMGQGIVLPADTPTPKERAVLLGIAAGPDWADDLPFEEDYEYGSLEHLDAVLEYNSQPEKQDEAFYHLLDHGQLDLNPVDDTVAAVKEAGVSFEKAAVYMFGGVGMAAEDGITEADLDDRVGEPDPLRKLVRSLMGEVQGLREALMLAEEQVAQMRVVADNTMILLDEVLKEVIIRG